MNPDSGGAKLTFLDMNGYQWTVILAAWLGWGFDVFDGVLFNYVAPNCVPTLLGLPLNSPEAKAATLHWTGMLTSVLLIVWAVGRVLFRLQFPVDGARLRLWLVGSDVGESTDYHCDGDYGHLHAHD